jgi:cytochrome c2
VACLALFLFPTTGAIGAEDSIESFLPENPLSGGKLFIEKGCVHCHAIYGEGGKGGPDLGHTKLNRGFLEVAGVMWNHSPRMEEEFERLKLVRPTFTAEEMAEIIAFVFFLNHFDAPGDPARGEQLFSEKGCQRCHSVGGVGGRAGQPLDRFRRYTSAVHMSTALWKKGAEMAEVMERMGVPRPTFQSGDVRDILAYIQEESLPQPDESKVFLQPGNPRNGERLFRTKHCIECHAVDRSRWHVAPDLSDAAIRGSISTIAGFQWNHGPGMWEMMKQRGLRIPQFTEREMSDIVTYLFFLQYFEEPGDPVGGAKLFVDKGCNACHTMSGEGSTEGPGVAEMELFDSPAAVIAAMWNHASEMEQMTWEKNIVWPILKESEMADLIAFLVATTPLDESKER